MSSKKRATCRIISPLALPFLSSATRYIYLRSQAIQVDGTHFRQHDDETLNRRQLIVTPASRKHRPSVARQRKPVTISHFPRREAAYVCACAVEPVEAFRTRARSWQKAFPRQPLLGCRRKIHGKYAVGMEKRSFARFRINPMISSKQDAEVALWIESVLCRQMKTAWSKYSSENWRSFFGSRLCMCAF